MNLNRHAKAEQLIKLLRATDTDSAIRREEMAFGLGVNERQLRRIRDLAERRSDFPIGCMHGYCRIHTRKDMAKEIRWRRAMRMAYKHLLPLARPKQTKIVFIDEASIPDNEFNKAFMVTRAFMRRHDPNQQTAGA